MPKELLTASRQTCLLACPRKHFYRYELGLKREQSSDALRFGSAFHAALEARFRGASIEEAWRAAMATAESDGLDDSYTLATLCGLLRGYYAHYGDKETTLRNISPEVEFRHMIDHSRTFDAAGKLDGLGMLDDGRGIIIEHKTTSEDISPTSDYWQRLYINPQICGYIIGAASLGVRVGYVVYDVIRKPAIKPLSAVPVMDENGLKQVFSADGERVYLKNGKPKQTVTRDSGEQLLAAPETAEAYEARLFQDTLDRPEFYFARKEVPISDDIVSAYETQREVLAKMILAYRQCEKRVKRRDDAWPRNCGGMTCRNCEYSVFCLSNIDVTAETPSGFILGKINEELSHEQK